ncbi:methyltransferase domain-containing protein [Desulfovibrio sp. ZJ369]|uniref:class I SAM-dependent methyltransferase n=1 Tax=Desulfovibrio sp. ZJ369 TaxID=2709793 RepID=UPI0013ED1FA1|nr:methyltransferase domain-containing protein [Desulfovibrio sp. ZJ369]
MKMLSRAQATQGRLLALTQALSRQALHAVTPCLSKAPFLARFERAGAFVAQWAHAPRAVGAVCPSGISLARRMADMVPPGDGLVVELGAGTGAVTRALRARIAPERLIIIERLPAFCRLLRTRFPELAIIQGDAARLCDYLPPDRPVTAVVSSLPLLSLPAPTQNAIVEQMRKVTAGQGCIIQFTYALWGRSTLARAGCSRETRVMVLRNLPPARVERFRP